MCIPLKINYTWKGYCAIVERGINNGIPGKRCKQQCSHCKLLESQR